MVYEQGNFSTNYLQIIISASNDDITVIDGKEANGASMDDFRLSQGDIGRKGKVMDI